jgi:hypothetical protein
MCTHTNEVKVFHETYVVKETGSVAYNAKALHETLFAKVTGSNPV